MITLTNYRQLIFAMAGITLLFSLLIAKRTMTPEHLQKQLGLSLPSPLQRFTPDWPGAEKVTLWIKRDDRIHPIISGNKWRKLSQLLADHAATTPHIVSFGGGFSNHLHALGWCCKQLGIEFTALVRGNYADSPTPMLTDLSRWQANIRYLTKLAYKQRDEPDFIAALCEQYPGALIIPEGGSQQAALAGVQTLLEECQIPIDKIITPVASGATMAGLINGAGINARASARQQVLGIAVLNGVGYLENLVAQFLPTNSSHDWLILHQFHHGGYARTSPALLNLCEEMQQEYGIPVEPVYSGKVFYALKSLLAQSAFAAGEQIVIVHTGGLQGARTDPDGHS